MAGVSEAEPSDELEGVLRDDLLRVPLGRSLFFEGRLRDELCPKQETEDDGSRFESLLNSVTLRKTHDESQFRSRREGEAHAYCRS